MQTNSFPAYSYTKHRRGSVLVAALVGMVVILVIIVGLMTAGMQSVIRGHQQRSASAASYLAEAGVHFGYWQFSFNLATLPYSGSGTLPTGSFTVQVVDNSANLANSIKITATGTYRTTKASITRIYNVPSAGNHIFDYAFFMNQNISTNCYPVLGSSGSGGDIRANGSISLPNALSKVNGTATATGSISITSVTGTTNPNYLAYSFPALSPAYYQSIAGASYSFTTVNASGNFYFASANQIIYVSGNVTVSGGTVINGTGTVFINGNLTILGSFSYAANSHIVILVSNTLTINSGATGIVGGIYVHNSSGTASTVINGSITSWKGSLVSDTITFNTSNTPLTITKDSFFTSAQGKAMYIPGY